MTSSQAQASAADAVGRHKPVLLERCLDLLAPAIEGAAGSAAAPGPAQPVMIDCTLGMGGHTEAALERFATLKVVGIDRDPEAIALASARLARFGDRFVAVQATYDAVSRVAHEHSVRAEGTVRRRESGDPVASTQDLAELVRQSVPAPARRSGGHPAKRTFQALRIAVNAELDVLERAVPRALNSLRVGGRLVVESYQSLEDRIVKRALAHGATSRAPQDLPVVPEVDRPYLELLTNGAEKADARELDHNPRSAPVRLRAAVRLRPADQAPSPEASAPAGGRGRDPGRRSGQRTARRRHRS